MRVHCCLSKTTFHNLKLAAVPCSSSLSFFYPLHRTIPFARRPHSFFVRVLSTTAAAQTTTTTSAAVGALSEDSNKLLKPQWKASIDFKWIRDNKEAVALNIKNRNSNANLEFVLELYEKLLNVQKERI